MRLRRRSGRRPAERPYVSLQLYASVVQPCKAKGLKALRACVSVPGRPSWISLRIGAIGTWQLCGACVREILRSAKLAARRVLREPKIKDPPETVRNRHQRMFVRLFPAPGRPRDWRRAEAALEAATAELRYGGFDVVVIDADGGEELRRATRRWCKTCSLCRGV
jgi:hypothetical protein